MRKSHILLVLFSVVCLVGCSVSLPSGYTQESCYKEYEESGLICVGYEKGIYESYRGGIKVAYRADAGIINGFVRNEGDIQKPLSDALKTIAEIFKLQEEIHDLLFSEVRSKLQELKLMDSTMEQYLEELKVYSLFRKEALVDTSIQYEGNFHFNFNLSK